MNYTDPHVYLKPPASRPADMYSVKQQIVNSQEGLGNALTSLSGCVNDHAVRIDELRADFEGMKALLLWITETHPEVLQEHKAIQDIERASK